MFVIVAIVVGWFTLAVATSLVLGRIVTVADERQAAAILPAATYHLAA